MRWGEKRYNNLDYYLKSRFGEKYTNFHLMGDLVVPTETEQKE